MRRGETRILLTKTAEKVNYSHTCPHPTTFTLWKKVGENFEKLGESVGVGCMNTTLPDYSGELVYECKLFLEEGDYEWMFDAIGGCLHMSVDGKDLGYRLVAPAKYRVRLDAGEHTVCYRFHNTLANEKRDILSPYKEIEAFGLLHLPIVKKL